MRCENILVFRGGIDVNYVMSDLHGCADTFSEMLKKINFSNNDTLYILGDVVDRGEKSGELLINIMKQKNVHCIMGNHEQMLLRALPNAFEFLNKYGHHASLDVECWHACGGDKTCASFSSLDEDTILEIYNYILSFPFYKVVNVNDKKFLLIHAGLGCYNENKPLENYYPDELVWYRFDHEGKYYPSEFDKIIVGHTPTILLTYHRPPRVFKGVNNVIDIDCGAVFEGGCLACFCLDTMEEFYV